MTDSGHPEGWCGSLDVEVRVLGPVEVDRGNGAPDRVHGLGARLLLALIADRGRPVDDGELVERLWTEGAPRHALASVRNVVAKLRRTYGATIVERDPAGYRVGVGVPRLDLDRLEAAVAAARADAGHDPATATATLAAALTLVRGRPFHEVADDVWAMPTAAAAVEWIAVAEELWAALAIDTAPGHVDVGRLRRAARGHPHRDVRWRHLVQALAADGRRTEALRAAAEARRALAEFGMAPDAELVALEHRLLGVESGPSRRASRVPARRDPMVGRDDALAALLGPSHVVWLEGEPGTGKTRLVAELADRTDDDHSSVIYVACPRVPGAGAGCVSALLAAADELLPVTSRRHRSDSLEPESRRAALAVAVVDRLRVAASERRLVVVVDDVQWLEAEEAATVQVLAARTIDVARWVLASRPIHQHPTAAALLGDLERTGAVRHLVLGNLTPAEVESLVGDVASDLDAEGRRRLASDVSAATSGHPLSVAEAVDHRDLGSGPTGLPRLDAIVGGILAGLDPPARRLVDVLAVAGGPCPVGVLAAACRARPADVLERAEALAAEGLLAPLGDGAVDLRHDLVRRAVERHLPASAELAARRDLVTELSRDPQSVVAYAEQLLRGGALLDQRDRDRAVAAAIGRLLDDADFTAARGMAERYADAADGPTGRDGLAAHLQAATALIACGDAERGRAILLRLREPARASGDLGILADTTLAMGPLMTGGREQDDAVDDAERVVAALPTGEGRRRVQLACWAAHQLLLRGERSRADRLLDVADDEPYGAGGGQGLILAMRAQAETLIGTGPAASRQALDDLCRYAQRRHDIAAEGASLLLGAGQAWAHGTLADVAVLRDRIAELAARLPRPDLRWWPLALDASIELAAGRHESATTAIETAARIGHELRVQAAASAARTQQLTIVYLDGSLGTVADALAPMVAADDAVPAVLAGYGLACVEAGDVAAVRAVASRLAAVPQLLVRAGASWPMVAMAASPIAAVAGEHSLVRTLGDALAPYSGTGLSLHSVGYFGSVDRCLGWLAVGLDDAVAGARYFDRAVEQEQRRGAAGWERRTAADRGIALGLVGSTNLRS